MFDSQTSLSRSPLCSWLKKTGLVLLAISLLGILLLALYLAWLHYNSQQLWQIVSQRCVTQQQSDSPAQCLLVNLAQRYVVFNDAKGPLHTLLIPTDKITGIESPALLDSKTENYFQHGWDTRYLLQQKVPFQIPERYLALAINSRYGRTQNQLHLHLACLKPEVYQSIERNKQQIGSQWQPLNTLLAGRHYIAINVTETTNPFMALASYVQETGERMDHYGLVRLAVEQGKTVLLATRLQLTALTLGSAEELLDFDCKIAI